MKKYLCFFLSIFLVLSVLINFSLKTKLGVANGKISEINRNISLVVERNIRQSIIHIRELLDSQSKESFSNLQRSVEDLTVSFSQWLDLNQTSTIPNTTMKTGLDGIEVTRNTIIHHLNTQYMTNNNQLMEEDIEMLEKIEEILNRLLLSYHNIEGRITDLKNPFNPDGGLIQIANNLEETGRLYRHSSTPNKHPKYIAYEKAVLMAEEILPELKNYDKNEKKDNVLIREGVHYYQINYSDENELVYVVYIDALDGAVRNVEYKLSSDENRKTSNIESIEIARSYLRRFYEGQVYEEVLFVNNDSENLAVYAFRFTPIKDGVKIISDAYLINVCANLGKVKRFSNDFSNTEIISLDQKFSKEEVISQYTSEQGDMKYEGLSIVKSFKTRFRPTLTYGFSILQKDQQLILYYDVETGKLVYQMYHIYEPVLEI